MSIVRRLGLAVAMVAALGVSSSFARAADEPAPAARPQGGGFMMRGSGLGLLQSEVVAKDLELTDDQTGSIKKIGEESRKQMQELRDSLKDSSREDRRTKMGDAQKEIAKKVDGVLNEKQRARLHEITLQVRGPSALTEKDVADALKLTDDQTKKLADLAEARRAASRSAFEGAGGDRAAAREKIAAASKESADKMLEVLTSEQKEAFEKMKGKKIELGSAAFGSFGGPGRGGRPSEAKPEPKTESK